MGRIRWWPRRTGRVRPCCIGPTLPMATLGWKLCWAPVLGWVLAVCAWHACDDRGGGDTAAPAYASGAEQREGTRDERQLAAEKNAAARAGRTAVGSLTDGKMATSATSSIGQRGRRRRRSSFATGTEAPGKSCSWRRNGWGSRLRRGPRCSGAALLPGAMALTQVRQRPRGGGFRTRAVGALRLGQRRSEPKL
jgi:hypothetical protein